MTAEAPAGERRNGTPKQQLFLEAFASADFFGKLHALVTHLGLNTDNTSVRSFIIFDANKRGKLDPLSFIDSERIHSGDFLEPTERDLELLRRRATEKEGLFNEADLIIARVQKSKPDTELLIIQEGPNFRHQLRNSAEEIPTWFEVSGRLKVPLEQLVKQGYYRRMSLLIPKDRKFFEGWQAEQILRFHS